MKVIIVGNGILGLSTAYRLINADETVEVVLVGKITRDGSASLAAAAMFNSFAEVESGLMENAIESKRFDFNRMSNRLWPDLLKELESESNEEINYGFGTYLINNCASNDLEDDNFKAIVEALNVYEEPFDFIDPSTIPGYKPSSALRATRGIYIPREGWVNPNNLLGAYDSILSKHERVTVINQNVVEIKYDDNTDAITSIVLDDGEQEFADSFVLCPGASFTNIINNSNLPISYQRIFYGVGTTILLKTDNETTENCIRTPNRGLACGLYTAPQDSSHMVIGASNLIAPEPFPNTRATSLYTLLKSAMEQLNQKYYKADFIKCNVGWRPTSSDTLPLIGKGGIDNLFIATGTKRDGLHCSPVISTYLSDLVLGNEPELENDFDISLFDPTREINRDIYTRDESISKLIKHSINAAYQHDFVPAKTNMVEELEGYYKEMFIKLHDDVGALDWGIPPELKDMYKYGHIKA